MMINKTQTSNGYTTEQSGNANLCIDLAQEAVGALYVDYKTEKYKTSKRQRDKQSDKSVWKEVHQRFDLCNCSIR